MEHKEQKMQFLKFTVMNTRILSSKEMRIQLGLLRNKLRGFEGMVLKSHWRAFHPKYVRRWNLGS